MKTQAKKDLQAKTSDELVKLIKVGKEELLKLKLDFVQNKLQNTRMLFWKKKEVAVLQTFLQMRVAASVKKEA